MKDKKLFLIDGTAFIYRAYYAIRQLSNSKGEPTNAIYGFVVSLRKLMQQFKPDYLAICFDRREKTFRHDRYKEYKAHRKPMPDDLGEQVEPIKEFCRISGYKLFEKAGYEADDLLGTLAKKGEKDKLEVYVVTGDKDAFQLVTDRIKIINPNKDNKVFGVEEVKEKFEGLGPEQIVDLMAMMGDASDNIPGISGVGEKTALRLMHDFGSIENLINNAAKIHSKPLQEKIKTHAEDARLSRELATINTDVPMDIKWEDLKFGGADPEKLAAFFQRYEFRGLLKEVGAVPAAAAINISAEAITKSGTPGNGEKEERHYGLILTQKDFDKFLIEVKKAGAFSFDTETTSVEPVQAKLVGMSFAWKPHHAYYVPVKVGPQGAGLDAAEVLEALRPILEDPKCKKFGQNIKYDWIVMKRHGVQVRGYAFDTMIASYLVNPIRLNHNLDDISFDYLGVQKITTESLIGKGQKQISMMDVPVEKVSEYACEDADCVNRLVPLLSDKLKEAKLTKLFDELEMPLAEVLAKMEINGVSLDTELLNELSKETAKDLEKLTKDICKEAGEEFNINSTKQLGEILFVKLGLPVVKRTKTGYSTDVSVLEKLAENYELPKKILEYREKSKLKSTYLDALPEIMNRETGLVHTSYNQTTTATGRLSSSDPNLQNIPIRTEEGRKVRKAFVPRPDKKGARKILSADYSQIELRILAHFSGDKNLTDAFEHDRDVHKFTATLLYGVSEKDVTRDMRNVAKVINFSVIYGKTAFGLSKELGISVSEADGFITSYFNRYKAVKEYLESQKELARKQGYLETFLGRRSYFPDIHSKNAQFRQFAERAAINAPLQGSAADLIKLAMLKIQDRLEREKFETLMIMQVHDELVFDMPVREAKEMEPLVRGEMESAHRFRVPLKVDIFTGDSWFKN